MLKNTYVGKGYKFGVVGSVNEYAGAVLEHLKLDNPEDLVTESEKPIYYKSNRMVDFDRVDGLSLKDFKEYTSLRRKNYVFFAMYDSIDDDKWLEACIRYICAIDISKNSDQTIDEYISKHLIEKLEHLNPTNKRRALAFLERYYYGTYEKTNSALQYEKK